MTKPNLVVLASTYPRWPEDHEPGFVHQLCKELSTEYEITVVTSRSPGARKRELHDGINVVRFSYAPKHFETLVYGGGILTNLKKRPAKWLLVPFFLASMALCTLRVLKSTRPAAIHCHWIIPQGLVLWLLSLITRTPPILITSHGADLFSLKGKLGTALKKRVLRSADAITVVSSPMKRVALQLGSDPDRTFVAPMGLSLPSPEKVPGSRIPGRILFVGRLVEKKGVTHLLGILPRVIEAVPETELFIIGDGPERKDLEETATHLGITASVHFLGALPQAELQPYYKSAALFCSPFVEAANGDVEGLGLVTLEAMSFSCPVLIGNVEASEDVIPAAFRESCLVDPRNDADFSAKLIRKLAEGTSEEDVAALKDHATTNFSWDKARERYCNILLSMISGD